jgi:parallel beta-helix repeat protein
VGPSSLLTKGTPMTAPRTLSRLALATIAGVLLAMTPWSSASAAVQCGAVLTSNTKLTSSLTCDGSGDALSIGADGVTLNLNGHTITGPGAYATAYAGVRVAGHDKARITNGKITGFQAAVVLDESTRAVVSKVNAYGNDQGLNLSGGGWHVIEKNYLHDNGRDALRLGLSSHNWVRLNVVSRNTFGIGVADGSTDNVVELNAVSRNGDFGIALYGDVARNVVQANVVDQSAGQGIQVNADAADSRVLKNSVSRNGIDGIHVESVTTTITRNDARKNAALGVNAPGAIDGGGNKAKGNGDPLQCVGVVCS